MGSKPFSQSISHVAAYVSLERITQTPLNYFPGRGSHYYICCQNLAFWPQCDHQNLRLCYKQYCSVWHCIKYTPLLMFQYFVRPRLQRTRCFFRYPLIFVTLCSWSMGIGAYLHHYLVDVVLSKMIADNTRPKLERRKSPSRLRSINPIMINHFANKSQTCQLLQILKIIF